MNILVTGGAGFIGSHLCERLLQEHNVICVDNLYTGNFKNLLDCYRSAYFDYYKMDITSDAFLYTFKEIKLDLIINLACPASPVHYQKDPLYTFNTSINGARNVLELARMTGARVVQASTSEVYGDPLVHPQPEEYFGNVNTIGIRSCYDEGKRGAETLFFDYMRVYGIDAGVFRIFNTYGPRMAADDGRVVSNFIVAALQGKDLEIYGDGSQSRSFCFVDDLVEAIVRFSTQKGLTGPINLGNPGEFTIGELSGIIVDMVGNGKVVHKDAVSDDPKQRKPIIDKAKQVLGWEPTIPLRAGLEKTIEYFRGVVQCQQQQQQKDAMEPSGK
jgi:UDP-glucuronate decarboxylase